MMKGFSAKKRQKLAELLSVTNGIITIDDAEKCLSLSREQARFLLWQYAQSGWLKSIKSGTYVPVSLETTDSNFTGEDPLLIAQHVFNPCYISGWSAASFWGFTDQLFLKNWVFTTQNVPSHQKSIQEHVFLLKHIPESYLYGLKTEWIQNNKIFYSDPHKTIIDFANFIEDYTLAGFLDVFQEYMQSDHKNLDHLLEYASLATNKTIFKRLGFVLEKFYPQEKISIEFCHQHISKGYSKISPASPCNHIVRRWNLRIPASLIG